MVEGEVRMERVKSKEIILIEGVVDVERIERADCKERVERVEGVNRLERVRARSELRG